VALTENDLNYDPYDHAIDQDPYPIWRRLRDEAPLYYNATYDFYALSRYDDVLAASVDWERYSSARGTVLEIIDAGGAMDPTDSFGSVGKAPHDDEFGMMIFMDPPSHDLLRRLVNRAFTPRRVAEREERIREICGEILDPLRDGGTFDFVDDFAAWIPTMVIGSLLGVPKEDQNTLRVWGDLIMRYEPDGLSQEKLDAVTSFAAYLTDVIADRGRSPRDDMVSDLLAAEVELPDGRMRGLNPNEVLGFVTLLELAGSETTARLLGWASILLDRHADQRALLAGDAAAIPNGVEEMLRYEPPSPIQARYVATDGEWYGTTVPAGSKIALLTGSAGRDERVFPDPDRFDVTRTIDRHLTFGYGVHYCLGANLARLEARVALEEMLARFPTWEVDHDAVELVRTTTVRGPVHVPVTV
jgi:cytochrome P450